PGGKDLHLAGFLLRLLLRLGRGDQGLLEEVLGDEELAVGAGLVAGPAIGHVLAEFVKLPTLVRHLREVVGSVASAVADALLQGRKEVVEGGVKEAIELLGLVLGAHGAVVKGKQRVERPREAPGFVEDVDLDLLGAKAELVLGLFEGTGKLASERPVLAAFGG